MTALERATKLDREDRLVEAAEMYERALTNESATRETYLDLAVLYFVLLDPGEASARRVSDEFRDRASRRSLELLREAGDRFGPHSEIEFWRRYIQYSAFGGDPFQDECRELANSEESLVPFFYLFAESGGCDFQDETSRLLQQVDSGATARQRYVRSILKSPAIAVSDRILAAARRRE